MARKRFTAEQIISKLRDAEVLLAQGQKVVPAPEAKIPQVAGTGSYPVEWTSNGPGSNLEGGLVRGGRSVKWT